MSPGRGASKGPIITYKEGDHKMGWGCGGLQKRQLGKSSFTPIERGREVLAMLEWGGGGGALSFR